MNYLFVLNSNLKMMKIWMLFFINSSTLKEPEWFHDLTHEEIVQLNCVFEQYEPVLGSLIERKAANQ